MRIGELARRSGVTPKAVRYYERLGLLRPRRLDNGYRDFDEDQVRIIAEIRDLAAVGISARQAAPFIDCLELGHLHGDDCASSLAVYRDSIAAIDRAIIALQATRATLMNRLDAGAARTFTSKEMVPMHDFTALPADLPVPEDDGAADHLVGMALPSLRLPATSGDPVNPAALGRGRAVLYFYPLTGNPSQDLPAGWDQIPGARGCTTEACDFRDHFEELHDAGLTSVYGVSSQDTPYQAEVVARLRLPFAMLSDERFALAEALELPTFHVDGPGRLYSRLTLVIRDGSIEHVFYPIFPPNTHGQQVLAWLRENPA